DLGRVPLAGTVPVEISSIEKACVSLKRRLLSTSLTERDTDGAVPWSQSMSEYFQILAERANAVAASLHSLEAVSERLVFDAYGLNAHDAATVANETGTPAGWFPLLAGFDALPPLPAGLPKLPHEVLAS